MPVLQIDFTSSQRLLLQGRSAYPFTPYYIILHPIFTPILARPSIQLPMSRGGDAVENENAPHTFGVDEKKTIVLLAFNHRSLLAACWSL